jgi:hypothetical protein
MSRLVLNGDVDANLGKYLPTPYIEKITLAGTNASFSTSATSTYSIHGGVTIPVRSDILLYDYAGGTSATPAEYAANYLQDNTFYTMLFYVTKLAQEVFDNEDGSYTTTQVESVTDPDGVYNARLPIKFFDQIINGKANPLDVYVNNASDVNVLIGSDVATRIEFRQLAYYDSTAGGSVPDAYIDIGTYDISYDEDGNQFITFPLRIGPLDPPNGDSVESAMDQIQEFKSIFFSSTADYNTGAATFADDYLTNIPLFNLQTSDVSYEIVFEEGRLGNPNNTAYFDVNGEIYQTTPLMTFNGQAYKIKDITYDQVVESFTELVEEYNVFYNRESGYEQLKQMINEIKAILARNDDPGILVRLFRLMKSFPVKTPTKPIGQLYKRLRRRINSTNAAIRNDQPLQRKIIADSKIVDDRPLPEPEELESIYIEGSGNENKMTYGLSDGYHSGMQQFIQDGLRYSYTNDELSAEYFDIVFGSIFFDYEKALHRSSNLSRVFNVKKMEDLGMFVPWGQFYTQAARVKREFYLERVGTGASSTELLTKSVIGCTFDETRAYPLCNNIYLREDQETSTTYETLFYTPQSIRNSTAVSSDLNVVTPYTPPEIEGEDEATVLGDAKQGYMSSLVFRQFLDPSNPDTDQYGISRSDIEKYRLMMFQLLDYRRYSDVSGEFEGETQNYSLEDYYFYVYVFDKTKNMIETLIQNARDALSDIMEYLTRAEELCSFNEDTERFNDFFRDAVTAIYEDNPALAPWYYAPVVYCLHLDLTANQFNGDMDQILQAATNISMQINPTDGNPTALVNFVYAFQSFITNTYDAGSDIGDTVSAMSDERIVLHVENLGPMIA